MQTIKPEKIITTISNLKTGEVYKTEDEWKAKGVSEAEIRRDVKVIMPSLDLFPKTKQCGKMAIIRSKIARQLLAEGGAPRKGFAKGTAGSVGQETESFDDNFTGATSSPSSFGGFTGSPEMGGRGTADTYGFDQRGPAGDGDDNFIVQTLKNLGTNIGDRVRAFESFINPNRDAINRARRRDFLVREGIIRSGPLGDEDLTVQGFTGDLASKQGLDFARDKGYQTIDDMIDKEGGGEDMPMIKLRAPIEEKEPELTDFQQMLARAGARFEDGGDVRQEYGLGSIVKKATRAVKKVVKSPVGKAALFATPFLFPTVRAGGANFLAGLTKDKLMLRNFIDAQTKAYKAGSFLSNPFVGIPAVAALSGLLTKQEEDEDETLPAAVRSDPEMRAVLDYYGQRFAQGGEVEDEMLDLGGNEMDLRGGGFVPLGEYEKKDDVPARLSKNEFVFTADAVRAAGGGSVDKGADVMYKTMKTLENKVA